MILGIIGGLGPAATIYFMDLITRMTKAECDQEHLEMLVHSVPSIPDRTAYILGKSSENPLPRIIETGQALERWGADVIAIPCMTAHSFHEELCESIGVPILNGITLTSQRLKADGVKCAGIMATDGTVQTGLFQNALRELGITPIIPSDGGQSAVMSLIYDDIKTGAGVDVNRFNGISDELFERGAERIILGCTELSLIKRDFDIGEKFVDSMEILAINAILKCGKQVNNREEENAIDKRNGIPRGYRNQSLV